MKLSMAIIEHWIAKYHPVCIIHSKEPTISGIRLFSYEKTPNPDYVYVGRSKDFFELSKSKEILIVHRKDVISLDTHELEDVFDLIMDAFVFYQNWEQEMLSAFQKPNPEQVIIDACRDIFGPIFYTNMSLQITAFSKQYPRRSVNKNWDDFWELGTLSVHSLDRMQKGSYIENLSKKWNCETFYEKNVEEYPYSMMISQENSAHHLTGQLTIISQNPFCDYQKHLAIFLKRALCLVANPSSTDQSSIIQSLFQDFLQEKHLDASSINTFYQLIGWKPEQNCIVMILKSSTGTQATYAYHLKILRKYFPNALFDTSSSLPGQLEEELICCFPLSSLTKKEPRNHFGLEVPEAFFQTSTRLGLDYYCSYPFSGVQHLQGQYRQAKTCLAQKKPHYYSCALHDLAAINSDSNCRLLALHPALHQIILYDQQKKTSFYEMLRTYLRCERNRVETAKQLFVHKNTLVYRLEKVIDLFSLNLDDAYEREYLLLSFRCLDERLKL